jgi:AraC family transcriptional regulator of adaptative response/methylated-DNA-[protein]-cysteine methyltransferase
MNAAQASQPAIDTKIYWLAEYIEQQAHKSLNLDMLAIKSAISPFHLQRKFKQIFGVSPKQFQNAIRIQRLKQSLKSGDDISGSIYEAGFGSTSRVYEQINNKLGMTPSAYRSGGKDQQIAFAMRESSFGHIIMAATNRGVCFVHIGDNYSDLIKALHREFPQAELVATPQEMSVELDEWISALENHLCHAGPSLKIPLHLYGTAFQLSVWKFLMSIKEGESISYSEAAKGINAPKAFRAVANACGANHIAILIPCHRVLRGDGKLGGYRWGVERKRQLLQQEFKRK